MTHDETLYLAGLLEGEGCFTYNRASPLLSLDMTDEDIIRKAQSIMGGTFNTYVSKLDKKTVYATNLHGHKAVECMKAIRPYMGVRRGQRIDEIANSYKPEHWINGKCKRGHDITDPKVYHVDMGSGKKKCKLCAEIVRKDRKFKVVS